MVSQGMWALTPYLCEMPMNELGFTSGFSLWEDTAFASALSPSSSIETYSVPAALVATPRGRILKESKNFSHSVSFRERVIISNLAK